MPRPYWSGNVQISLVSFGVSLYVAVESKSQISFHQISRRTGERIRHQKVLESAAENKEATTAVENDEIVKGYEYRKGQYVIVEPSELENLRVPSKHTIAVSQFVDVADLNPEYVEKPYFVTPENDMSAEAFNVVRQALLQTGKAAIGKVAFSGRENIIAVVPAGADSPGMMAYTLRYQYELRNRADYFRDIKQPAIPADSLELAETLIKRDVVQARHRQVRRRLRNGSEGPGGSQSEQHARAHRPGASAAPQQCGQFDGCPPQEHRRRQGCCQEAGEERERSACQGHRYREGSRQVRETQIRLTC